MLFNIFVSDMSRTNPDDTDDLGLATQSAYFDKLNSTVTEDLNVENCFSYWRLHPNPLKTTVTAFQISNRH